MIRSNSAVPISKFSKVSRFLDAEGVYLLITYLEQQPVAHGFDALQSCAAANERKNRKTKVPKRPRIENNRIVSFTFLPFCTILKKHEFAVYMPNKVSINEWTK